MPRMTMSVEDPIGRHQTLLANEETVDDPHRDSDPLPHTQERSAADVDPSPEVVAVEVGRLLEAKISGQPTTIMEGTRVSRDTGEKKGRFLSGEDLVIIPARVKTENLNRGGRIKLCPRKNQGRIRDMIQIPKMT